MRSESEVIHQILTFARSHPMIRAVMQNGSRVNPNVVKDIFCDYDVVYGVTDTEHFLRDQSWIKHFGKLIIFQQNDWELDGVEGHIFLMLFSDGVRIDLSFFPAEHFDKELGDSLSVVLLDKDNLIPKLPPPDETTYYLKKPTRKEFNEITNEFWWCSTNIAKGIWRDELCYVKYMHEVIVRPCLIKMLEWYINVQHGWRVNPGYLGKWFKKFLPPEMYASLVKTYPGVDYDEIWEALFEAGRLFRCIGGETADALGYTYPLEDDRRVSEYLKEIRLMSK